MNSLSSSDSSDRLMEMLVDGDNAFAVFDENCKLVSFSSLFAEMYKETGGLALPPSAVGGGSGGSSGSNIKASTTWREILVRAGCRVPIALAPTNLKPEATQEVLLGKATWIKVHSWRTEDGSIVSVHSDISEIKLRIRNRRLRFQLSRSLHSASGRAAPTYKMSPASQHRRASTGACCHTIAEFDGEEGDDESFAHNNNSNGVSSSCGRLMVAVSVHDAIASFSNNMGSVSMARSLPNNMGRKHWQDDESREEEDEQSLAATPLLGGACFNNGANPFEKLAMA